MKYRKKLSSNLDKKIYRNTANKTHVKNLIRTVSRGGTQL